MALPEIYTPDEVAQRLRWSERRVRSEAKRLGACLIMGNRMRLTEADVIAIMESQRCPSVSTSAARFGTSGVRLPAGDFEALAKLRTKPLHRASLPRSKSGSGKVVSMAPKPS